MDKVRIGFVGVGSMGQMAHLRHYVNLKDCDVAAIAELREQTGQLVARRYGIAKVYRDHAQMLAAEKLDAVVCIQPFSRHAMLLPEIYPHVKFVLTEKPLAVSVEAGRALVAAAAAAGCTHMVGYHKRSDPATAHARQTIEELRQSGRLGRLKYVRILMPAGDWVAEGMTGMLNAGDKTPPVTCEPKITYWPDQAVKAYVEFVNYYIHQVNLMRHLLGQDYGVAHVDPSGVVLVAQSTGGVPAVLEMSPYRTTRAWEEEALVAFEKGYVRLCLPAPLTSNRPGTVEIYSDPGDGQAPLRTRPDLPWIDAMRQQAMNFVKVCQGRMAPPADAAEALKDLEVSKQFIQLRHKV